MKLLYVKIVILKQLQIFTPITTQQQTNFLKLQR